MSLQRIQAGIVEYSPSDEGDRGYLISHELAEALNISFLLKRPLLVTGEPGTGKSMLARAVARQLGFELHEFVCKSSSTARDLFYQMDHLRRLYDAYHQGSTNVDPEQYVTYAALGRAMLANEPKVVLIDEIDKAVRDFPNDLLAEIARSEFCVPEIHPDRAYQAKHRPFVIITSNSERQLPLPFLRRCTYFHIDFPNEDELRQIVELQTGGLQLSGSLVTAMVKRFLELRAISGLTKKPATDELVAWAKVIEALGISEDELKRAPIAKLPGISVLIKLHDDQSRLV